MVVEDSMRTFVARLLADQGASAAYIELWKVVYQRRNHTLILDAVRFSPYALILAYEDFACCIYLRLDATDFDI